MLLSLRAIFYVLLSALPFEDVLGLIGGHDITIEEAPYLVNYGDICGGVLIQRLWALSSAHCGTEHTFIRLGSKHRLSGIKVTVITHVVHPRFGEAHKFDFDIQLLRMRRKLHFYSKISAIGFSDGEYVDSINVSGWGYTREKGDYNEILQQVQLPVVPKTQCQEVQNPWYNHTLTDKMFCAGGLGMDACQGDSGGGAVYKSQLVGISSFGFGCGRGIPGVYTDLTGFSIRGWIRHHTGV